VGSLDGCECDLRAGDLCTLPVPPPHPIHHLALLKPLMPLQSPMLPTPFPSAVRQELPHLAHACLVWLLLRGRGEDNAKSLLVLMLLGRRSHSTAHAPIYPWFTFSPLTTHHSP
jgi:hypothetical protein